MNSKLCSKCKFDKPLSEYYVFKTGPKKGTPYWYCIQCASKANKDRHKTDAWRERHLKRHFGLTQAQYDEMYRAQNGLCFICERPETATRNGKPKQLAVDHNHKTGQIRKLLCSNCNTAIGKINDDPQLALKIASYLE